MMKIIMPSLMILPTMNHFSNMMMSLSFIIMTLLMLYPYLMKNMMNSLFFTDNLSMTMIMLTLIMTLIIIMSSTSKKIMIIIIMIFTMLILTFSTSNMINFYILFEAILIPTMILIMMYGKQSERLQASIYFMIYTITASLPLLISILLIKNNQSFNISFLLMYQFNISIMLMMAFLVKTPMYFTHLWLPKAHVEAPLEGSMILAAILLKLGSYGMLRFIPICFKNIKYTSMLIISISLMGATITSLNCLRQKDLKMLIAYSSVAHMGFILASLFTLNTMGKTGAIIMMVAHAFSSSALFFLVNDLYMKYMTRNTLSFKGLMNMTPNISFWWFMFMAINISAPPSINTLSEIFLMSSLINWNITSLIMIMLMSLATTSFSMIMFINISHNNSNKMTPSNQTNPKSFLSLFYHFIPLLLLLMKMQIFT